MLSAAPYSLARQDGSPCCVSKGHFRRLYQHVREEALKAGVCGLRLYADVSNARAHATYSALGMTSHYQASTGAPVTRCRSCWPDANAWTAGV